MMANKQQHSNRLIPSEQDDILLAYTVEENYLILCRNHLTVTGERLIPPTSMNNDIMQWRTLRVRHKQGDLRHTEAEMKSVRAIAQWTVDVNHALCQQSNTPKIEWGE
ncbi:hypothetical protein LCGC14_0249260 [marine sediment metagenome]|uniref:Uncharacterized protein n=1 Tax=marine sediment metagenome TaxID=412755 RepID=A0A0F9X9T0_9ZZZZ